MELTFHMICPFLVQLNNNWNKEMLKYFLVQNKSKYNYKKSILWGTVIELKSFSSSDSSQPLQKGTIITIRLQNISCENDISFGW